MKRCIAYFDLLGFKQFILNNDSNHTRTRLGHVLRDLETSLSRGIYKDHPKGLIADLKKSTIKCLNISDTIMLWTQDDSPESVKEFLDVCYGLNWRLNTYNFPIRGIMVYDEFEMIIGNEVSEGNGMYNVNIMYGKGLVYAHGKCENQSWAGCSIDSSLENFIVEIGQEDWLKEFALKYMVPYTKPVENQSEEFALRLVKGELNNIAFQNVKRDLTRIFEDDNKGMNERSRTILKNTLQFLEAHKTE